MILRKWEDLPQNMQTEEVREYYEALQKKKTSLFFKRVFDIAVSFLMLVAFLPFFAVLAVIIKIDSKGPKKVTVCAYQVKNTISQSVRYDK